MMPVHHDAPPPLFPMWGACLLSLSWWQIKDFTKMVWWGGKFKTLLSTVYALTDNFLKNNATWNAISCVSITTYNSCFICMGKIGVPNLLFCSNPNTHTPSHPILMDMCRQACKPFIFQAAKCCLYLHCRFEFKPHSNKSYGMGDFQLLVTNL